jgi:hypothetical protein
MRQAFRDARRVIRLTAPTCVPLSCTPREDRSAHARHPGLVSLRRFVVWLRVVLGKNRPFLLRISMILSPDSPIRMGGSVRASVVR